METEGALPRATPGRVELAIPGLARVEIHADAAPAVVADPRAAAGDVAWLLDGPVRQIRRLMGHVFALRAATVAVEGRAVALVGHAAAGKSLTAAALAGRGHRVLSDGWLPVTTGDEAVAHPTGEPLGLWPAGFELLGLVPDPAAALRPGLAKRTFAFSPQESPVTLAAIVHLRRETFADQVMAERLDGAACAAVVSEFTAHAPLVPGLGLAAPHFRWMIALARIVPMYRITADRLQPNVTAVADAVEAISAGLRPAPADR